MKFSVLFFLVALIPGLFVRPAAADDFSQWLATLKKDAQAQGVQAATIDAALHNVQPMPQILDLDRKQPETTLTLAQYLSHVVTPARIEQGRKLRAENAALLRSVASKYGVAPKTIMALWAIESGYGHAMGDYRVVDTLVTLAYDGRRPDLFRAELIAALKIIGQGRLTVSDLKGSWAGAMGQIQFMPTTYLKYGVDFDRRGDADIWRDTGDVFASAANYLSDLGWNRNETWGREVKLPARFDPALLGLPNQRTVTEWAAAGVRRADGGTLPPSAIEGSIVAPDGLGGRAFLVYGNFRTIMKWNRSTYFALAVGLLSDAIGN
jgi:membrane-bound lytic murein transglycosylase B